MSRKPASSSVNHGWNHFDFGNGIEAITDNTAGRVDLALARKLGGKPSWISILPKSPIELELFLSWHYSMQKIGDYVPEKGASRYTDTTFHSMLSMSYKEWGQIDTGYLKPVLARLDGASESRIRELNKFKSLPASSD